MFILIRKFILYRSSAHTKWYACLKNYTKIKILHQERQYKCKDWCTCLNIALQALIPVCQQIQHGHSYRHPILHLL